MSTEFLARMLAQHWWRLPIFPAQRALQPGRWPSSGQIFADLGNPEKLLKVFRRLRETGGPAPGPDGIRFGDMSITEAGAIFRQVAQAVRHQQYRPYATRAVRIPKANGGFRELNIGNMADRVVAAAVEERLSGILDAQLLPGVYGFRTGQSVLQLLAAMERIMRDQNRFVVVTDDIRDAFPSVPISAAVASLQPIIQHPQLLQLVAQLLRGAQRERRLVGIDQGLALSPMTMNVYVSECLDRPFTAAPANPPWLRWADNIAYLTHDVAEANLAIQHADALLTTAGLRLKGTEGTPINLLRQGARKLILGYEVSWRDSELRLGVPSMAWPGLHLALTDAHEEPSPHATAQAVIRGWLDWYGCAISGADVGASIGRVLGVAARLGYRELGHANHLEERAARSRHGWEAMRQTQ